MVLIHSTVVATVDAEGHPVTRVIDMMLHDDNRLYFLTAKGKVFYEQLMEQKFIAISGMTGGEGSMCKKAVSVRGKVVISQEHCLHCGNCMAVCSYNAVEKR